jgi:hypothetical protein
VARKLIEQYRRLPDFDPEHCTPIKLSDGQEWFFPKPWLSLIPIVRGDEVVAHSRHVTFGDDLDVLLEAIAAEENPVEQIMKVLALAIFLLKRNYDLQSDEFQRILTYRVGDSESEEMINQIIDVTLGGLFSAFGAKAAEDPKAFAVGSDST